MTELRRLTRVGVALALVGGTSLSAATSAGAAPNTTTRVNLTSSGQQTDSVTLHSTYDPAMTPDGRFVTFYSFDNRLVPNDNNPVGRDAFPASDIFVKDRQTGNIELVSVSSPNGSLPPAQGDGISQEPDISADGRYVTFMSSAGTLAGPDTNGLTRDIFVHDRQTGATTRVSEATDGTEGNSHSTRPAISADGRYVTFMSTASTLVSGDTNVVSDVFVHELATATTTRASVAGIGAAAPGAQGNAASNHPDVSADGRYVAFDSAATNLIAGDSNGVADVFVHDRQTGATTRVSVSGSGAQANANSTVPALTPDGRYVSFRSAASNLVPGDTNGVDDLFVHDRLSGSTTRVSVASDGTQGNGHSGTNHRLGGPLSQQSPVSANGRYVAFRSEATNLVDGDTNGFGDVFVHDRLTGATTRASVANSSAQADSQSAESGIDVSGDGRFVAFDSHAENLVDDDTNGTRDIFVRELAVDEVVPVVSVGDVAVTEGDAGTRAAVFTLSLSEPAPGTVTVAYATANGTATKVGDYTAKAGTASFAPGATTAAVKVPVAGDIADESDESFNLGLSSPVGATLGDAAGVATIYDDDPGTGRRLAIGDVSVHEGDAGVRSAVFTVSLSKAATSTVTVAYATANGTATKATGGDYTAKSGTVSIAAGATSATVKVAINPDTAPEADETFTVTLSSSSGPTITRAVGTGTIVDDE